MNNPLDNLFNLPEGLGDTAVLEATPPEYKVIMLNDNFTPMEFVVHVLQLVFGLEQELATRVMLTVHTKGSAICGIYPRDIAETRSKKANQYARLHEYPLRCQVEEE